MAETTEAMLAAPSPSAQDLAILQQTCAAVAASFSALTVCTKREVLVDVAADVVA